jgi:hypothetical protein
MDQNGQVGKAHTSTSGFPTDNSLHDSPGPALKNCNLEDGWSIGGFHMAAHEVDECYDLQVTSTP